MEPLLCSGLWSLINVDLPRYCILRPASRYITLTLDQCRAGVGEGGPTLNQRLLSAGLSEQPPISTRTTEIIKELLLTSRKCGYKS